MRFLKWAAILAAGVLALSVVLAIFAGVLMTSVCTHIGERDRGGVDWDCRSPDARRTDPDAKRLPKPEERADTVIVAHVGERRGWPGVPEGATALDPSNGHITEP